MKQRFFLKAFTIAFMFMLPLGLMAQTIKGKVTDTSGSALPYMNVLVKGTSTGTTTSDSGEFSLTVKSLPVTIVVSSIGFKTKEVTVTTNSFLTIAIEEGDESLGEIIVTGSRTAPRSNADSPLPIDVVGVKEQK